VALIGGETKVWALRQHANLPRGPSLQILKKRNSTVVRWEADKEYTGANR
jgi:hypothetical protein